MLLEYGNTVVFPHWELNEKVPVGYSRIYYIMDGNVTYEDGQRSACRLKPGFLYALPSTLPYHVWRTDQRFFCTYLHMVFSQAHITGLIELHPDQDCLHAFICTLQQAIEEKRMELLDTLAEALPQFLQEDPCFVESSSIVHGVRQYIFSHISQEITLEELSALQGYHPNYFIKLFSKETGLTPHQYVIQCRMQYAAELLNQGMSNQAVGEACNYSDTSTFTRAFHKYYGVTPQKYRQGYRKP